MRAKNNNKEKKIKAVVKNPWIKFHKSSGT